MFVLHVYSYKVSLTGVCVGPLPPQLAKGLRGSRRALTSGLEKRLLNMFAEPDTVVTPSMFLVSLFCFVEGRWLIAGRGKSVVDSVFPPLV